MTTFHTAAAVQVLSCAVLASLDPFIVEHQEVCKLYGECQKTYFVGVTADYKTARTIPPDKEKDVKKCCGYCTCETYCYTFGTCCLQMYGNFTHGRQVVENSR